MNAEKLKHISLEIQSIAKQYRDHEKELTDLSELLINEANELIENKNEQDRELALKYAFSFIGTWYSWGGSTPEGIDCSGFIVEILQAVGIIGRKTDYNALGLWLLFQNKRVTQPYSGCLVFWHTEKDKDKIIHIEMCVNDKCSIGASGGGSNTITKADAIRDNAFVKIRPFNSRPYIRGFVDPFLNEGI